MAHIQQVKDKEGNTIAYRAFVELGIDPATGNRKRITKTFDRSKDAEKWASKKINSLNEGTFIDPSEITVKEYFLNRWLENHKKPNIAATTYDGYMQFLNGHILPELGALKLQDLKPHHLETYFNKKRKSGRKDGKRGGLTENSLKKHYVIINEGLKRAIKLEILKANPAQGIDPPKPKKPKAKAMSKKEYHMLLEVLKEDQFMYTFVMTDLMTGMRRSEILGLEWSDIDLINGIITVEKRLVAVRVKDTDRTAGTLHESATKTDKSTRRIKISNTLIKLLKTFKKKQQELRLLVGTDYDDSKQFVFSRPDGKNYHPRTISRYFKKAVIKAELPKEYSLHTLRHTFATINLKNGVPAKIVQEMLGHSKVSTTLDIYTHVDLDMQKEAVKKLDDNF